MLMSLPIKMVCFDLNKTLIYENTWFDLNQSMGMSSQEDARLLHEYNGGRLSYVDWQKILEQRYRDSNLATKSHTKSVINRYTYKPGAREIVSYLQRQDYIISLISGSMDLLVETIAKELSINHFAANNRFIFDPNDYLTSIECQGNDTTIKADQLRSLCKRLEIDATQVVCVGDGDNDIELFKLSKHGVTFKNSPIEKHAWRVIERLSDLQTFL